MNSKMNSTVLDIWGEVIDGIYDGIDDKLNFISNDVCSFVSAGVGNSNFYLKMKLLKNYNLFYFQMSLNTMK